MSISKAVKILLLLSAATHLWCVQAINYRGNPASLVVQGTEFRYDSNSGATTTLFSELWSDLVIERAAPVTDFTNGDAAVKAKFVKDCAVTFEGPEPVQNGTEKAFSVQCAKAGGMAAECDAMIKDLRKARDGKKLEPWCEKTFGWFASKTKPKCLSKCRAYLCKDRCDLNDKINDVSDKVAAYHIKLEMVRVQKARADNVSKQLEAYKVDIDKVNETTCIPAGENVTKLEQSLASINKELATAEKATSKAKEDHSKAFDELIKIKANMNATKLAKNAAQNKFNKTADELTKARAAQVKKNKESKEMAGQVRYAQGIQVFQCQKVADLKVEYDKNKKANDDEVTKLTAEEKKIKTDMDTAAGEKKGLVVQLKNGLKAA